MAAVVALALALVMVATATLIILWWRWWQNRHYEPPKYFLSALVTAKNESMILDEFLEHLRDQGFDHVFLIDNDSSDGCCDKALQTYGSDFITLYKLPEPHAQVRNYNHVYRQHRHDTQWMAVIDTDEFLFGVDRPLREVLAAQPQPCYFSVPWNVFGSSGHVTQPSSIRQSFVWRHPHDPLATSPQRKGVEYPESFVWFKGLFHTSLVSALQVHEHSPSVPMVILTQDDPHIRLHHYIIQSWEYFSRTKMERGDSYFAGGANPRKVRDRKYFETWDAPSTVYDDTLAVRISTSRFQNSSGK